MRAWPLKVAAQYVGGALIAAFFVALLSFTFSFLGTIFCAALAGMMLGAVRTHKWQAVPVSLFFPLVVFLFLRGMKTELDGRQILVVALACLGVFWLTYAVAAALFYAERKGQSAAGRQSQVIRGTAGGPQAAALTSTGVARAASLPGRNGFLSLEMLQGNWSAEPGAQTEFRNRQLCIEKEKLVLSVADAAGDLKILARARVTLCTSDAQSSLLLSKPAVENSADTLVSI